MTPVFRFDNSYARLPSRFFAHVKPTPVANPNVIAFNDALANELGLDRDRLIQPEGVEILSGNVITDGATPIAQAYAGHQFGGWSPQLGDGRAVLLGEHIDPKGLRHDIQLKGAGRTPFSRSGDGRAWIGPVIREFLVSEAMHALGIPTTRALAAIATGESVQREKSLPGAILTRAASSHIRVGTFQFFAARQDIEALRLLTEHVIVRHFPDAETALDLLHSAIERQAALTAKWMGVGFIHGVMNTDNAHVAGLTIDYGPCAFMDTYHPEKRYSSIDQFGRYAFVRQPDIATWNMAQLATSLLPLIDSNRETAIKKATEAVHRFPDLYRDHWLGVYRAKLGLSTPKDDDESLINDLLRIMERTKSDYTNTFRQLSNISSIDDSEFKKWHQRWMHRRGDDSLSSSRQVDLMNNSNPAIIPRNHHVENVIQLALENDYKPLHRFFEALTKPFVVQDERFTLPPKPGQEIRQTFCGT